jgi:RNA polymerase sigma-70 factor (ECF subfamily)
LQRYLLGLNVPAAQAEELVQEALLRLWRRADLFDPARASLSTWLFRVARNLYIDSVRGEPHWLPIQDGLDRLDHESTGESASSTESFTDHAGLSRAIDELPAQQARLIRMSYFEAKSHSEIAHELGMPLGSVKSNLRRAFAKLQAGLRQTQ